MGIKAPNTARVCFKLFNKYLIEEGTFIDLEDVMNKYPEVEKVDYNARESS